MSTGRRDYRLRITPRPQALFRDTCPVSSGLTRFDRLRLADDLKRPRHGLAQAGLQHSEGVWLAKCHAPNQQAATTQQRNEPAARRLTHEMAGLIALVVATELQPLAEKFGAPDGFGKVASIAPTAFLPTEKPCSSSRPSSPALRCRSPAYPC